MTKRGRSSRRRGKSAKKKKGESSSQGAESTKKNEGESLSPGGEQAVNVSLQGISPQEEEDTDIKVSTRQQTKIGDLGDEPETSPKNIKFVLQCHHPNSQDLVNFEVYDEGTDGKSYAFVDSDKKQSKFVVRNYAEAGGKKYALRPVSFDITLKDWLKKNTEWTINDEGKEVENKLNRYSSTYEYWGVKRPTEMVKNMIVGIINAVFEVHEKKEFHGGLENSENYALTFFSKSDNLEEDSTGVKVFLLYENMHSVNATATTVEKGQKYDMWAVTTMIFGEIISSTFKDFPKDLQSLYRLLNSSDNCCCVVANHPSLWNWKERYHYFGRLWQRYKGFYAFEEYVIGEAIDLLSSIAPDWRSRVVNNTPIGKFFKNKKYGMENKELVRFVRHVFEHIMDSENVGGVLERKYIKKLGEEEWMDLQYIEHQVTVMFPNLLSDLYESMASNCFYL